MLLEQLVYSLYNSKPQRCLHFLPRLGSFSNDIYNFFFLPFLSSSLYMMWGRGPISLFCMCISNHSCTIWWQKILSQLNYLRSFVANQVTVIEGVTSECSGLSHWAAQCNLLEPHSLGCHSFEVSILALIIKISCISM